MFEASTGGKAGRVIRFQYTERRARISENRDGF